MKYPRCFKISLLVSLASIGCDGDAERNDPEEVFDMTLLEQDDDGDWYAPINEGAPTGVTDRGDPSTTYFPMHNHLTGISGQYSYWSIHRDGGHGTVCGLEGDFTEQCSNVSAYIGASSWFVYGITYCGGGFVKNASCMVW